MYAKTFLAAAALALGASAQSMNLTALLASQSDLTGLVTFLGKNPSIAQSIASMKNITLFAPNNAAIQKLASSGLLNTASESQLSAVLSYHVLPKSAYGNKLVGHSGHMSATWGTHSHRVDIP